MARLGHRIEELLETGNAADILGRGTAGAITSMKAWMRASMSGQRGHRYVELPFLCASARRRPLAIGPRPLRRVGGITVVHVVTSLDHYDPHH